MTGATGARPRRPARAPHCPVARRGSPGWRPGAGRIGTRGNMDMGAILLSGHRRPGLQRVLAHQRSTGLTVEVVGRLASPPGLPMRACWGGRAGARTDETRHRTATPGVPRRAPAWCPWADESPSSAAGILRVDRRPEPGDRGMARGAWTLAADERTSRDDARTAGVVPEPRSHARWGMPPQRVSCVGPGSASRWRG